MLLFFALLLVTTAAAFVGLLLDDASTLRRPYARARPDRQLLTLVAVPDRRTRQLPFVGNDRREIPLTVEAALAYAELRRGA